jgi:CheY-like chemotaxis protein
MRAPESTALNPTILVVEDEEVVGLFIQQGLIDAGFEVLLFSAAEAALEAIKSWSVAAAVLDVGLPGMKGDELARCVHAVRPDLPIFPVAAELQTRGIPFTLATGYGEQRLPRKWRKVPCLHKPYEDEQLTGLISHLVRRRGLPAKANGFHRP